MTEQNAIEQPEIILKEQYEIDSTGEVPIAVPEVLVLANRAGFRWLSEYFREMADRTPHRGKLNAAGDPDAHQRLPLAWDVRSPGDEPLNKALSDRIAFRLGYLTPENRDIVYAKYGISAAESKHGCMASRFRELADDAGRWLSEWAD
ncbi:MAG: hypothetical protein ACYTGG_05620 [Planctomycetota bacterium]|jgi:hypothetical protein